MVSANRMQRYVDMLTLKYDLSSITIEMKDVKVGRARYKTNRITLPFWLCKHKWPFVTYYLIHEVCHFLHPRYDNKGWHDAEFKKTEDEMLYAHGLRIERAKAYARYIFIGNKMVWEC